VAVLRARTFGDLLQIALDALQGKRSRKELLEIHQGREITIKTALPQPVQLDGNEAEPTNRLEVRVEPQALGLVYDATSAEAVGNLVPAAALTHSTRPLAIALFIGGCSAAVADLAGRSQRHRGVQPHPLLRHPLLMGILIGTASFFLGATRAMIGPRAEARPFDKSEEQEPTDEASEPRSTT
jgi:hypothetical protein